MWKTTFLRAHRERLQLIQASGGISLGNANAAGGLHGMLPSPTTARLDSYLDMIANAATQDSVQLNLLLESNKTLIEQNRLLAEQFTALSARVNATTPTPTPPPSGTRKTLKILAYKLLSHARVYGACYTHFSDMQQVGTKSHYFGYAGGYEGGGWSTTKDGSLPQLDREGRY